MPGQGSQGPGPLPPPNQPQQLPQENETRGPRQGDQSSQGSYYSPLRFGVTETPQSTGDNDTNSRQSHQHIVHFLEDEEILKKVPSMLPLLTGSVRSPRIAVSIEEQEIIVLLDTGAEVSVLPKSVMSDLIGDGSRHVKLGESKSVKPFANADVMIEGPWCLSVVVCGVKITHPFYSMDADVPAVVGIDLLTVAKLVIDVKKQVCVLTPPCVLRG